jgi:DNA-3-methyladenine glycosylase II
LENKAYEHFKKVDSTLYEVAIKIKLNPIIKSDDYFIALVESIISQQLSIKASDTIFGRFKKLFPKEKITPIKLLEIPDQKIREAGISFSKIKYIKSIAEAIINKQIDLSTIDQFSDDEVILELIKLKGVGQWTAEMFLMFTLGRPDVFSTGDLGLQNAIIKLYKLENKPNKDQLLKISSKWSPYRTIASRILWKSLEL